MLRESRSIVTIADMRLTLDRFPQLGYEDLFSSKSTYLHHPSRTGFLS
jgi:hypothetical protein